jgi:hypothetical protein
MVMDISRLGLTNSHSNITSHLRAPHAVTITHYLPCSVLIRKLSSEVFEEFASKLVAIIVAYCITKLIITTNK